MAGAGKLHYLNAEPINAIADRWITQYDRARVQTLADLKTALETEPMSSTEFVYTTYIKDDAREAVASNHRPRVLPSVYGPRDGVRLEEGLDVRLGHHGLKIEHPEQVILESDPYRRLAFTFHTFIPELTTAVEQLDEETVATCAAESRSKVSFDIEPEGDQVKLTVIHDDFGPDSTVLGLISGGWPWKLANLKTALEQS